MTLNGPVIPKHAIVTPSLNPSTATSSRVNEVITCPQTGRMWICTAANVGAYAYQQVLPYTRNDGTPSLVGTQMVNDGGAMKVVNATGSTAGYVNLFNKMSISATDVHFNGYTPNGNGSILALDTLGNMTAVQGFNFGDVPRWSASGWTVGSADFAVFGSKTTDQSVTVNTPVVVSGLTITPGIGDWLVTAVVTTKHINANRVNVGIEVRDLDPAGTKIVAAAVNDSNGYSTITVQTLMNIALDDSQIRVKVQSPDASSVQPLTILAGTSTGANSTLPYDWHNEATGSYVGYAPYALCTRITASKIQT